MSIHAAALPPASRPSLRLIGGGSVGRSTPWWERRAQLRTLVGGQSVGTYTEGEDQFDVAWAHRSESDAGAA